MQVILLVTLFFLSSVALTHSLPLSTNSRWIVAKPTGERVKLRCVNWAGHLEPMLAEGLDRRPLGKIARHVSVMGFNCVRLTWATYMVTRHAKVTVAQSFRDLGLEDALAGIVENNPDLLNLTVVDAQNSVIEELGLYGVMVILDNQVSQPMWCCSDQDGNGFFGDKFFDPTEWLQGLALVANRYKYTPSVVAMSMRNEFRGPLQNESVWYEYIEKGMITIHEANSNLLIIVSGLNYDLNLIFLKTRPLQLNFENKLVYEIHRYSFSEGQKDLWLNQPINKVCENITQEIKSKSGFLIEGNNPTPLFVSEFGINQLGLDRADNMFLGCFLGYLAEMDLDWSVWALQGSYYIRDGLHGPEETYGMLTSNWTNLRSSEFHGKLQLIQQKLQDPYSKGLTYYILYHPLSGRCIQVDNNNETQASDCLSFSLWSHGGNGTPIHLKGSPLCLTSAGDGFPVTLSTHCMTKWEFVSNSTFQLANKDEKGINLCLEWNPADYSSKLVTKKFSHSLDDVGLKHATAGIEKNNAQLLNLTVVDLHKAMVSELEKNNIMVVLDNHIRQPQWCCSNTDGNGFFGDVNFDPKECDDRNNDSCYMLSVNSGTSWHARLTASLVS
ncbi:Cellulase (glycosyl hydrolase family 5) protein [Abeliophyllum distichum]|uniref:Cellulase (Glycosyl hydrolase family 5) protein n=1 Tax=Abeliophyllum distichum TaxID=126358 RepID=A0ABD1TXF6_9LAMI